MAYFPTWKGGRRMERLHHYFHEDMAFLLEADHEVTYWTADAEPIDLEYDDGEVRPFRHSFRAETRGGLRLIRLRDESHPLTKQPRTRARPVEMLGVRCEFYGKAALAGHPRLRTSKEILFHRPRPWTPELPHRVATMAAMEHPDTLGGLHLRLGHSEVAFEDLVSLVAQGFIDVDLDFPVGPAMPVLACNARGYLG